MIAFVLALNVCVMAGDVDQCDAYIVESYATLDACRIDMRDNRQSLDDRFVSCGIDDVRYLRDKRDGRTVKQIIADLNAELPYNGGAQ